MTRFSAAGRCAEQHTEEGCKGANGPPQRAERGLACEAELAAIIGATEMHDPPGVRLLPRRSRADRHAGSGSLTSLSGRCLQESAVPISRLQASRPALSLALGQGRPRLREPGRGGQI